MISYDNVNIMYPFLLSTVFSQTWLGKEPFRVVWLGLHTQTTHMLYGANNSKQSLVRECWTLYLLFNSDGRDEAEEPETGREDVAGDAWQGRHRGGGQGRPGWVHQDIGVQQRTGRTLHSSPFSKTDFCKLLINGHFELRRLNWGTMLTVEL